MFSHLCFHETVMKKENTLKKAKFSYSKKIAKGAWGRWVSMIQSPVNSSDMLPLQYYVLICHGFI